MQALVVVDAQNEFSARGLRAVPAHDEILARIRLLAERARAESRPIAWIRHYNKPHESKAFVPGTWGSELSPGLGPVAGHGPEVLFEKDVFGAFTFTGLEQWLRFHQVKELLLAGFFTHMCVSTSAREALVRGFDVTVEPLATGAHQINHPVLGSLSADEVRRTALLQLHDMGVNVTEVQIATATRG